MADEFDGCEAIWSHELAMQRLINFIRQNQNACTDTECIDVSGRILQPGQVMSSRDSGGTFTIAMVFMLLAMFMYIMNPSTWRQLTNNKPSRRGNNPDGAPPPQPPAIN